MNLNDISDLLGNSDTKDISIKPLPDGKEMIFSLKEEKELKAIKNLEIRPEQEIEEELDIKMDEDESKEEDDFSNLLFISDGKMPTFSLHTFENCVEYQKDLFQNRTIHDVFQLGGRYIWINIKENDARAWVTKNLKKNAPYNITLVYGGPSNAQWINLLSSFLIKKPSIISKNKLLKVQSFSSSHFVKELMDDMIKLKKPAQGIYYLLRDTFGSSKK